MNNKMQDDLELLLDRILNDMEVFLRRDPTKLRPLSEYGNVLRMSLSPGGDDYTILAYQYSTRINDQSLRDRLSDFMSRMLADHIHDNSIRLASFEIHGGVPVVPLDDLLDRLLDLAIAFGAEQAAANFVAAAHSQECHYSGYTLIGGVTTDIPLEIYDGVRLIPAQELNQPFLGLSFIPPFGRELENRLADGAIIEESWSLLPRFIHPDSPPTREASTYHEDHSPRENTFGLPLSRTDSRFAMRINSSQVSGFNADQFCRALSLTMEHKAYPSVGWRALPVDEITRIMQGSGWSFATVQQPERRSSISREHVQEARPVYEKLMAIDDATLERLTIPIDRLIESTSHKSQTDRIIDLGIALESLFLPDQSPELKFRLRTRAARHLGMSLEDRKAISKLLGKFYNVRSKAVHTGKLEQDRSEATTELLTETQRLCRRSITKILSKGRFPEWTELELE